MAKGEEAYPPEIGKSKYNRESGKKTLRFVGIIIVLIVGLCITTLLLFMHVI